MELDLLPDNLIIFDGICKFCNASVNFIIRHDSNTEFSFATVQSNTGKLVLRHFDIDPNDPTTFLLYKSGHAFTQSTAALKIAEMLARPWCYLRFLRVIPKFIRDLVYVFIARNRYRIIGKLDQCVLPNDVIKSRFLD